MRNKNSSIPINGCKVLKTLLFLVLLVVPGVVLANELPASTPPGVVFDKLSPHAQKTREAYCVDMMDVATNTHEYFSITDPSFSPLIERRFEWDDKLDQYVETLKITDTTKDLIIQDSHYITKIVYHGIVDKKDKKGIIDYISQQCHNGLFPSQRVMQGF